MSAHSPDIFGKQETEWMCRLPTTAEMKVIMRGEGAGGGGGGGGGDNDMLSQVYGVCSCVLCSRNNLKFACLFVCSINRR